MEGLHVKTFWAIKQKGTNKFIPHNPGYKARCSIIESEPMDINECTPRIYKTKQGATWALNYYLGKIKTEFVEEYFHDKCTFEIAYETLNIKEEREEYNLEVIPIEIWYYI